MFEFTIVLMYSSHELTSTKTPALTSCPYMSMAASSASLSVMVGLPSSSKRLAPALCSIIMIVSAELAWPVSSGLPVLASTSLPSVRNWSHVMSVKSSTV